MFLLVAILEVLPQPHVQVRMTLALDTLVGSQNSSASPVVVVLFPGDVAAAVVTSVAVVLFLGDVTATAAVVLKLRGGSILGGVARDGVVRLALRFELTRMGFTVVSQLEGGSMSILEGRVRVAVDG